MSFWEKVKETASKAQCKIGIHSGTFSVPEGSPKCHLERKCPTCGDVATKPAHAFKEAWSEAPFEEPQASSCLRVQKCIHCEREYKSISHEGYSQPRIDNQCREYSTCTRCGDIRKGPRKHSFEYAGVNGRCERVKKCGRCGYEMTDGYSHNFVRTGSEGNKIIVSCIDCGKTECRNYL